MAGDFCCPLLGVVFQGDFPCPEVGVALTGDFRGFPPGDLISALRPFPLGEWGGVTRMILSASRLAGETVFFVSADLLAKCELMKSLKEVPWAMSASRLEKLASVVANSRCLLLRRCMARSV